MKKKFMLCIGSVSLLIASCTDHDADNAAIREQLVAEGVKIRVEEFRQREWDKCVERARLEAVVQVDSLIRAMAKQNAIEPVAKPPKPERPEKPGVRMLPDSMQQKLSPKKDSIRNY